MGGFNSVISSYAFRVLVLFNDLFFGFVYEFFFFKFSRLTLLAGLKCNRNSGQFFFSRFKHNIIH